MAATANSIVQNWMTAMQGGAAAAKYTAAINNVTANPMAAAAAAVQNGSYMAGVQAAVNSGKMVSKLNAASFANWKTITSTVGAQNLVSGAAKGQAKMAAAAPKILAAGQAGKAAAAGAVGAVAKMTANMNAIKAAWGYGAAQA